MPFSMDHYFGQFTRAELASLQRAYLKTCIVLGRQPESLSYKDELVHEIIQVYECGVLDPEKIADVMKKIKSVKRSKDDS